MPLLVRPRSSPPRVATNAPGPPVHDGARDGGRPQRGPRRGALVRQCRQSLAMDVHRHSRRGRACTSGRARAQRQARRQCPSGDRDRDARRQPRVGCLRRRASGRAGQFVAAGALGIGAGIGWVPEAGRPQVAAVLGLTAPAFVRTVISLGHPTDVARKPRSAADARVGAVRGRRVEQVVGRRFAGDHRAPRPTCRTPAGDVGGHEGAVPTIPAGEVTGRSSARPSLRRP